MFSKVLLRFSKVFHCAQCSYGLYICRINTQTIHIMKTNKGQSRNEFDLKSFNELSSSEMNKISGGELIAEYEVLPDGRIIIRVGVRGN